MRVTQNMLHTTQGTLYVTCYMLHVTCSTHKDRWCCRQTHTPPLNIRVYRRQWCNICMNPKQFESNKCSRQNKTPPWKIIVQGFHWQHANNLTAFANSLLWLRNKPMRWLCIWKIRNMMHMACIESRHAKSVRISTNVLSTSEKFAQQMRKNAWN